MSRENDYVIVAGDFGLIWDDSRDEKWWIDWFSKKPFTLLFVDGNHENHDILMKMPVEIWHGGKTHVIADNIRHLMRGQVFNIDGKKIFTFGGGRSHDIQDGILDLEAPDFKIKRKNLREANANYRVKSVSWWESEMPSEEEYSEGIQNLDAVEWSVDYVITHVAPTSIQALINKGSEPDRLTQYLESIHMKCEYNKWYFGHYHQEKNVTEKDICLYKQIKRTPEKLV